MSKINSEGGLVMKPISFPEHNIVYAKDQPEYQPLPAYRDDTESISCWQLTWFERFKLLWTGRLWFRQMNFGTPLQPILPTVHYPFTKVIDDYPQI
jgi:hypothetical protein